MKDIQKSKPSDIVKKYGFSSLNEVSRGSEISSKTLIKWSRTKAHRRRFTLVLKGLILEKFSEWAFSKANLLRKDNEGGEEAIFTPDVRVEMAANILRQANEQATEKGEPVEQLKTDLQKHIEKRIDDKDIPNILDK